MPSRHYASDRRPCTGSRDSGTLCSSQACRGGSADLEKLKLDQNEKEMLEHIVKQMESERGLDRAAAIAHMRI